MTTWRRYALSPRSGERAPTCSKCDRRSDRPGRSDWTYRYLAAGRGKQRVESRCGDCADPCALELPALSIVTIDSDARRAYGRLFYQKNRARIAEQRSARRKVRRVAGLTRKQVYSSSVAISRRRLIRHEILSAYGKDGRPACVRCGFADDHRALQIDHVNNDGAAHRRQLGFGRGGGIWFYRRLRRLGFPPGYQTLCANCNTIKDWERHGRQ